MASRNNDVDVVGTNEEAPKGKLTVEAARHICEEARIVLCSLRGGPPAVARGRLAADLRDLRVLVKSRFLDPSSTPLPPSPHQQQQQQHLSFGPGGMMAMGQGNSDGVYDASSSSLVNEEMHRSSSSSIPAAKPLTKDGFDRRGWDMPPNQNRALPPPPPGGAGVMVNRGAGPDYLDDDDTLTAVTNSTTTDATTPSATHQQHHNSRSNICIYPPPPHATINAPYQHIADNAHAAVMADDVGPYARPFLSVVVDPRAAGPHTLVALRSLHRLLQQSSLIPTSSKPSSHPSSLQSYGVSLEPLARGVLACRFEQTDAGADEAVEMAIADFLSLLVDLDASTHLMSLRPDTFMEAFNTVFVTRNTFVHSPALCYHFEEVLTGMARVAFTAVASSNQHSSPSALDVTPAKLILEFLVNQLLHSPLFAAATALTMGRGPSVTASALPDNAASAEAMAAYDATRILCLKLARTCLSTGWDNLSPPQTKPLAHQNTSTTPPTNNLLPDADQDKNNSVIDDEEENRSPLAIVQDDLCLALLMTGQALWAYQDSPNASSSSGTGAAAPGGTSVSLIATMEQPSIVSLEVLSEICATMSCLWTIPSLQKHLKSQFESIFTGFYQRALSLLRKLPVPNDATTFHANQIFDAEVEIVLESLVDILCLHDKEDDDDHDDDHKNNSNGALVELFEMYDCDVVRSDVALGLVVELSRCCGGVLDDNGKIPPLGLDSDDMRTTTTPPADHSLSQEHQGGPFFNEEYRHVPAHLKELCAEALVGGIKSVFCNAANIGADGDEAMTRSRMMQTGSPPESVAAPGAAHIDRSDLQSDSPEKASFGMKTASNAAPGSLRHLKEQKALMKVAASLFNEKSSRGIEFLASSGIVSTPITPRSVALFLRNGIVVGLDKRAVGEYLGAAGKAPVAHKSPPDWERDWFHKEALHAYCSLFEFERQHLLDGLRTFLAAFRLPGEAQQIDRILQAFAEACSSSCDESASGRLKLFSTDEKKAADAAYLLSFSIIMLNTDLHNDNIRPDRKMTVNDFVRNNTDYGRDITDEGMALPRDYLEGIYDNIKEEQIRTEGEGADGVMTVERWKDVLRGGVAKTPLIDGWNNKNNNEAMKNREERVDLVIDNVWMSILSSIGGFWGMAGAVHASIDKGGMIVAPTAHGVHYQSGMLGARGARLGMDLAMEMMSGLRNRGRLDLFRHTFVSVCHYTGLLDDYSLDTTERTSNFVHSVERQSAVNVAISTAKESGDVLGYDGWVRVWGILFELRDLRLLGATKGSRQNNILMESDSDLLTSSARHEWNSLLVKEMEEVTGAAGASGNDRSGQTSIGFFKALFGSDTDRSLSDPTNLSQSRDGSIELIRTPHGKEELMIWDDLTPSDDEDGNPDDNIDNDDGVLQLDDNFIHMQNLSSPGMSSAGAAFESQLIHEDHLVYQHSETPVTGLETVEDTRAYQLSPRARVQKRLSLVCDFEGLISESRFLDKDGIHDLLSALVDIIRGRQNSTNFKTPCFPVFPISPASEAFAEILLCEIALKNRDRISLIWNTVLRKHYVERLGVDGLGAPRQFDLSQESQGDLRDGHAAQTTRATVLTLPSIEKCATGLLRICCWTVHRDEIANDVISTLKVLCPPGRGRHWPIGGRLSLDKHLAEGLWRICRNVDALRQLNNEGWDALLGLVQWCATRGEHIPTSLGHTGGLSEDDPALQAFRSIHLMLHATELKDVVPFGVVGSIRSLIIGADKQNCPKLTVAGLDLLSLLHARLESLIVLTSSPGNGKNATKDTSGSAGGEMWAISSWLPVLEGMAETAETSRYPSVRQHALSMLTDAILTRHGDDIPNDKLCGIFSRICIPLAGNRITDLLRSGYDIESHAEEIMIEFEMCISLIFKPFLHHLRKLIRAETEFAAIWISILGVMTQLLGNESRSNRWGGTYSRKNDCEYDDEYGNEDEGAHFVGDAQNMSQEKLLRTTKELGSEHLRNAVMVLISLGVLHAANDNTAGMQGSSKEDLSSITWNTIQHIEFCSGHIEEWQRAALVEPLLQDAPAAPAKLQPNLHEESLSKGGEQTSEL